MSRIVLFLKIKLFSWLRTTHKNHSFSTNQIPRFPLGVKLSKWPPRLLLAMEVGGTNLRQYLLYQPVPIAITRPERTLRLRRALHSGLLLFAMAVCYDIFQLRLFITARKLMLSWIITFFIPERGNCLVRYSNSYSYGKWRRLSLISD